MKFAKEIRRQARVAQRAAAAAADAVVAEELSNLARAFQAQADVHKRRKKEVVERKKTSGSKRKKKKEK